MSLLDRIVDLLYPVRCVECRSSDGWLCGDCLTRADRHGSSHCARCGAREGRPGDCVACKGRLLALDSVSAAFEYTGPIRTLVHRFKYSGLSGAADWMAGEMEPRLPSRDAVLTPVPIQLRRERMRGFNQAGLLARALSDRSGLAYAELLHRVSFAIPQEALGSADRWENVRGAFESVRDARIPRAVTLVDDVCTTGATLEECARVLKSRGAQRVDALVFARA